jgi:hypothetical protein
MQTVLDALWLAGVASAATFMLYGLYVGCAYRCQASVHALCTVARLAMRDSARVGESIDELRAAARVE